MTNETRLVLRATNEDILRVAVIADALRATGRRFVTRADAVRHALAVVAGDAARGEAA